EGLVSGGDRQIVGKAISAQQLQLAEKRDPSVAVVDRNRGEVREGNQHAFLLNAVHVDARLGDGIELKTAEAGQDQVACGLGSEQVVAGDGLPPKIVGQRRGSQMHVVIQIDVSQAED